ncbi:MAG TPA: hypothetical protein PKD54_03845 [Pirellulaceae bacterium]|nr:hypothetical protein [Pirellulaceae bacterium]
MISRDPALRTAQIITFGIVSGTMMALIIFLVLKLGQPIEASLTMLTILGLAASLGALVASFVVPRLVWQQGINKLKIETQNQPDSPHQSLAQVFMTSHIVKLAILEGAAFLNLLLFFLELNWVPLGVTLVLIAWMAIQFPREDSVTTSSQRRAGGASPF